MKKMFSILFLALTSIMVSMPANASSDDALIPRNIIIKQTTHFNDGRVLVLFYKKQGTTCEVYSPCNEKDYNVKDASKIKSTNFEVVDRVEGKLYRRATIGEVLRLIRKLVNKYL